MLGVLKIGYDILFLYGLKSFDVSTGAFTFSITVVVLPVILLTMKKQVKKKTWISVALVLIGIVVALGNSLAVAIPFKVMSVIPGFTDIRPVLLLKPVYGVFFGIPLIILMQEELGFKVK